jgi:hypothetical protein
MNSTDYLNFEGLSIYHGTSFTLTNVSDMGTLCSTSLDSALHSTAREHQYYHVSIDSSEGIQHQWTAEKNIGVPTESIPVKKYF